MTSTTGRMQVTSMIRCYHARKGSDENIVAPLIAVIDSDEEGLEAIWDCCNNSCWWDGEDFLTMTNYRDVFDVHFTPDYRGYCNDDLIVEMKGKFHVAQEMGWDIFNTFDEALEHCKNESYWCRH